MNVGGGFGHSGHRSNRPAALATVAAMSSPKTLLFLVPWRSFLGGRRGGGGINVLFWSLFSRVCKLLNFLVTNEELTSTHNDVYSAGVPKGAFREKYGHRPHFPPGFLVCKRTLFFFWDWWFGCYT